jgi:hypothetical protein
VVEVRKTIAIAVFAAYERERLEKDRTKRAKRLHVCKRCGKIAAKAGDRNCKACQDLSVKRPERMCVACLVRVGFGCTLISKWVRVSKGMVRDVANEVGVKARQRKTLNWKRDLFPLAKIEKAQLEAWRSEATAFKRGDESTHWSKHPLMVSLTYAIRARADWRRHKAAKSNYHIAKAIRSRVYRVLKGTLKSAPTEKLIGCTWQQLRAHIERQFKRGMRWENHGKRWHIDHKIPCASFDLSKPEQQRACFHFSNLQPLEAKRNISKSDSIEPCQPELLITF